MAVHPINVLSLCSGIGGLDLGVRLALGGQCRTVGYVEREAYAAAVLVARMEEAALDPAPIWDDLSTFDGRAWSGRVDLVTGGYPCQPFSLAGSRRGEQDERHLWPHVRRIVAEVQPTAVFFENVAGHISLGLEVVVRDLEGMGYRVAAGLFTAEEVGAPHKRERVFILGLQMAHSDLGRREGVVGLGLLDGDRQAHGHDADGCSGGAEGEVGDANESRLEGRREPIFGSTYKRAAWPPGPEDAHGWRLIPEDAQPSVRRVADGAPVWLGAARADRLRALGNGVVPQQAALAFSSLMKALHVKTEAQGVLAFEEKKP